MLGTTDLYTLKKFNFMVCELFSPKQTKPQGPLAVAIPNFNIEKSVSSSNLWVTNPLMVSNFLLRKLKDFSIPVFKNNEFVSC